MLLNCFAARKGREVAEWREEAGEGEGDGCQKSEGPPLPRLDAAVAAQ